MTFTDDQLWAAVHSVGRDGQSFTCATVRESLGMSSKKRHDLAQFRDRFRAFRLTAGEGIVKVGKTSYRLKTAETAVATEAHAPEAHEMTENLIELELIVVAADAPEALDARDVTERAPAPKPVPAVREQRLVVLDHPAAIEEADLGFGESMEAGAADSGELAADHVIFSAWPESLQAAVESAAPKAAPQPQTEAQIEAEVRELVAAPKGDERRSAPESLIVQAEQAVARTWRGGGQWLGRRFAELFSRN